MSESSNSRFLDWPCAARMKIGNIGWSSKLALGSSGSPRNTNLALLSYATREMSAFVDQCCFLDALKTSRRFCTDTHAPLKSRRLSGIFPRMSPLRYVLRPWLMGTLAMGPRSPCSHVASRISSGESNSPALSMPARAPSGTQSRKA